MRHLAPSRGKQQAKSPKWSDTYLSRHLGSQSQPYDSDNSYYYYARQGDGAAEELADGLNQEPEVAELSDAQKTTNDFDISHCGSHLSILLFVVKKCRSFSLAGVPLISSLFPIMPLRSWPAGRGDTSSVIMDRFEARTLNSEDVLKKEDRRCH